MVSRKELLRFARENRKKATKPEQIMWRLLRSQQLARLKFRRQHLIDPFVVDFACPSAKLVVELDGDYHELIGEADLKRQQFLESQSWRVLRFTNDHVESNAEAVLVSIVNALSVQPEYERRRIKPSGMMKPSVHKNP